MKPLNTTIFSFPQAAPKGAITRDHLDAIKHLKLWLVFQKHYCEHKPSVTISYREEEFATVGDWVWNYFDDISGVSFLPFSDHTYQQAPYQECSEEKYLEVLN
ncbi:hypothetical protein, partial [Escherichia coli]|uniref:hypothetical protein n=1 Tax=Escherichia coli TaxID=562 RepID=UPI0019637D97